MHFIQFNCVKEPTIIPMGIRLNLCLVKLKKTEGLYEANHEEEAGSVEALFTVGRDQPGLHFECGEGSGCAALLQLPRLEGGCLVVHHGLHPRGL